MPDLLPKISVITPSYNQGIYIEDTILSVISQAYPNLEYIIMDGGSTDNTVEIIKKYENHITYWQSCKDDGQSSAINDGFQRATGQILCWLCSDDIFIPGTLLKIGRLFASVKEPAVILGNCINFHQTNLKKVRGSDIAAAILNEKLTLYNFIYQPSAFWNREAWVATGELNISLQYSMDWDWFIRAQISEVKFIPINDYLSLFRWHENHKTSVKGKNNPRDIELGNIYLKYNSGKIKRAFLKIRKIRNGSRFMNNLIYAANFYNITPLKFVLHLLICPTIKRSEYFSLTRM
jgi:glycosyltransferase involved in cell wall biosynthesis